MADVFQLAGSTGGTGNGYWAAPTVNNSAGIITNASGINFIFQKQLLTPNKIKLTWQGTLNYQCATVTVGDNFAYWAIIPLSALPLWCQPLIPPGATTTAGIGLGSGPAQMYVTGPGTAIGSATATLQLQGTNLKLTFEGNPNVVVASAAAATVYNVLEYYID